MDTPFTLTSMFSWPECEAATVSVLCAPSLTVTSWQEMECCHSQRTAFRSASHIVTALSQRTFISRFFVGWESHDTMSSQFPDSPILLRKVWSNSLKINVFFFQKLKIPFPDWKKVWIYKTDINVIVKVKMLENNVNTNLRYRLPKKNVYIQTQSFT